MKSENSPSGALPRPDQLDYALLRVAGDPGAQPVGAKPDPAAPIRGFIEVPETDHDFVPGAGLYILQHPDAAPLQLALDTDAVISVNSNGTRLTYRTNTLPGSSGSPCFSKDWELVALHHSGDPLQVRREFFRQELRAQVSPSPGYERLLDLMVDAIVRSVLMANVDDTLPTLCRPRPRPHHVEVIASPADYRQLSSSPAHPQIIYLHDSLEYYVQPQW